MVTLCPSRMAPMMYCPSMIGSQPKRLHRPSSRALMLLYSMRLWSDRLYPSFSCSVPNLDIGTKTLGQPGGKLTVLKVCMTGSHASSQRVCQLKTTNPSRSYSETRHKHTEIHCRVCTLTSISLSVCSQIAYTAPNRSWSAAALPAERPQQTDAGPFADICMYVIDQEQGLSACVYQNTAEGASKRRYACVRRSLPIKSFSRKQQVMISTEILHDNAVAPTYFQAL